MQRIEEQSHLTLVGDGGTAVPSRRPGLDAGALAVTICDVEPRTFTAARRLRAWLDERGCDRITLAVVPAADLHPLGTRSPALTSWLRGRAARGDAVAQYGLRHRGNRAEFSRLGADESLGRVAAGLCLLREVELDPRGFIAPAYGYTPALRRVLADRFDWFAERSLIHGTDAVLRAPALGLGTGALGGLLCPAWTRLRAAHHGTLMRLDLQPSAIDSARRRTALEEILERARGRQAVSYDDVFA